MELLYTPHLVPPVVIVLNNYYITVVHPSHLRNNFGWYITIN